MRLVDRGSTTAVTGKSSVRQKVRGIGEDQIHALGGQLRKNSYAISLVELKAWPGGEGSQLARDCELLLRCFRNPQQFRASKLEGPKVGADSDRSKFFPLRRLERARVIRVEGNAVGFLRPALLAGKCPLERHQGDLQLLV